MDYKKSRNPDLATFAKPKLNFYIYIHLDTKKANTFLLRPKLKTCKLRWRGTIHGDNLFLRIIYKSFSEKTGIRYY